MRGNQPRTDRRHQFLRGRAVSCPVQHPPHRARQHRWLRDAGCRRHMLHAPYRGSREIIVGWRMEHDLRHQPVVPLAFQKTLHLGEPARLIERRPAHRDKRGIPVPLERVKPIRRHRVTAAIVPPHDRACLFDHFGHVPSNARPVSVSIQAIRSACGRSVTVSPACTT